MKFDFYIPLKERIGLILFFLLIVSIHSYSIIHAKINGINKSEKLEILHEIAKVKSLSSPIEINENDERKEMAVMKMKEPEASTQISNQNFTSSKRDDLSESKVRTNKSPFKKEEIENQIIKEVANDINAKHLPGEDAQRLSKFDPNKATYEELRAQGLDHFAATNLNKYVSGGGKIYRDSDMLKIYGVDTIIFDKIVSRIAIETNGELGNKTYKKKKSFTSSKSETVVIDLNQADTSALKQLRGIGSSYAKRIIKYRDKLGGFITIDQVLEVYQFPPETFERIKGQLRVSGQVKKIFVPSLSFKEVLRHPYIDFETTKALKNISIQNFESTIKTLIEKGSIDKRILPYLYLSDPRSKTTTVTSLD